MDIMFAINAKSTLIGSYYEDLTDYSSKQIILNNLRRIDYLIEEMLKAEEEKNILARSVIILAGELF